MIGRPSDLAPTVAASAAVPTLIVTEVQSVRRVAQQRQQQPTN